MIADGEASSAELRTVLAAVAASESAACSSDEIAYFRKLIFESEFVKDAGRIRDGKIECSAALGKLAQPRGQSRPDFTQQDGTEIYTNMAPYRNGDLTVTTLALDNSFVVFTPLTRMHLEPPPLHYTETVTDAPSQRRGRLLGERPQVGVSILATEGTVRWGDSLYVSRCSIRFFNCATAYATIPEVLQANRGKYFGFIALCGLVGACWGLFVSLVYRRNKSMEQQLRRAIRNDKLRVFYQPQVRLANGCIVAAEALARWTNEEGLPVGPNVFIRLAEEHGFVGEITALVVRHVLRDMAELCRNRPGFCVSVNVTATDLADPEFLPMLDSALYRAAVPAQSLAIEITESSTARQDVAIETIRLLRMRGHSVHIDDFGTGYSSLAYLHELSVDAIKIDKAFTQAIGTGSVIVAILPQILAMAEALNLEVIAEGVETPGQANFFAVAEQPILGQGWLFGRPVPAAEFHRLLVEDAKRPPCCDDLPSRVEAEPPFAA
jgi:sensor c-di-GMP phosphodiesterase-like protein